MIDANFVEKIAGLAGAKILDAGESRFYSTAPLHNLPLPTEPRFPTVPLATLDSLADYVRHMPPQPTLSLEIWCSAERIELVGQPDGEHRERDVFARVTAGVAAPVLGQYSDLENFRINLLVLFQDTPDRAAIMQLTSRISDENVVTADDDGITQKVNARVGIATHEQVKVPSPVKLKPIRTFIELDQPEGQFIFRMQKGPQGVQAALFEIPTNWRREAAVRAAAYLRGKAELKDITILA